MLKKVNRGLKRSDFEESRKNGKMIQGKYFGMSIMEGEHTGSPIQFGFVISKKISKLAVERNRIKRLIAEGVRRLIIKNEELKIKNNKIIFLVKRNILEAKQEEIEIELEKMIHDSRFMKHE